MCKAFRVVGKGFYGSCSSPPQFIPKGYAVFLFRYSFQMRCVGFLFLLFRPKAMDRFLLPLFRPQSRGVFYCPLFYCPYLKYFPCRRQSVRLQPCTLGKELLKLQQNKSQKEQTSIEVHLAAELIVARFFVGGCVWCKIIIDRPCKTKAEKDE